MTPEQQQQFELIQFLNKQAQKPLSYEEFLAQRGAGNPYAPAPSQEVDYSQMMSKAADKGTDYLDEALFSAGGGGTAAAGTGGTMFSGGATVAGQAVGTAANGGTMMSTGVIVPASQGAPVASTAMGAEAAATGAFDLAGIGSTGNAILPLGGAALGYDLIANRLKTGDKKRGAVQGLASGAAMGSYFGPVGAIAGGVLGLGVGLTAHESTRDAAKRHTKQLQGKHTDDPVYQAYVRGMREQFNSGPPDPSKPFAGKYGSWDEYKNAGLEAGDLTGVMGNIETFGNDWTKLNFDQQKAVTQGLIDAGLYNSKKGEVLVTDKNRAKQIYDSMAKEGFKIPTSSKLTNGVAAAAAALPNLSKGPLVIQNAPAGLGGSGKWVDKNGNPVNSIDPGFTIGNKFVPDAPVMIPRSKTRSPGIGLDGKPISYGRR